VSQVEPGLSLATVYNAVEAFAERGLCRRIACAKAGGPSRFDADMRDHVHVVAPDGRVLDVPQELASRLMAYIPEGLLHEIEQRLGLRIDRASIQFSAER
jgi:Fe2+ or Zn2+ uptake regulation protein